MERGAGEKLFIERTMMLATGSRIDNIALEMFRLRSHNEHLDDWPSKLGYVAAGRLVGAEEILRLLRTR